MCIQIAINIWNSFNAIADPRPFDVINFDIEKRIIIARAFTVQIWLIAFTWNTDNLCYYMSVFQYISEDRKKKESEWVISGQ